jgi:hypothetical protein
MRDDSRDPEFEADQTEGEQRSEEREYGAARAGERIGGGQVQRDPRKSDREDGFSADDLDESLAARREEEDGDVF